MTPIETLAETAWAGAIARHPDPGFRDRIVAANALYAGRPVCVHRTPVFLSADELRRWQVRLARFHRIVRVARARLLGDLDREECSLAAAIGVDRQARIWAQMDPGYVSAAPLARLDAFVAEGLPQFVELNAEAPAGMGYAAALAACFTRDPAWAASNVPLRHIDPLPSLRATLRALWRERALLRGTGPERPATVAILDFAGGGTAPDLQLIRDDFRAHGLPCEVVDPADLTYDGERLAAGDFPIDLVFRRAVVRDLRQRSEAIGALLAALREGRVCMVNPLRTALLHTKGLFSLLHAPTLLLDAADRRFVTRHIPETLLLVPPTLGGPVIGPHPDDTRERVRASPDQWVLKPVDEHGGTGVILGWTCTRTAWESAVDNAAHHVVQRRVPTPRKRVYDTRDGAFHARMVTIDPFLARGRLAGFLSRIADGELANATTGGATQTPLFIAG